ncbi:putative ribonuclease H-like domain-containing protein [Tanacetum coccineum]
MGGKPHESSSLIKDVEEGLHKGYDRFQSLLSQLEIHGVGVSTEDANQKFLRVFESDIKGSTASSSSTQNVAFVSSESTNSTNDVSTVYGVSTSSGYNSQKEGSSSYTDKLKYSFFSNQSSGLQLDHEDLKQVDEFDLEEMDLKWQVAMISMRLKKFYKKTRRRLQFDAKEPVGFGKTKVECFNCHNTWHFARECRSKGNQESKRRDAGNTRYKAKENRRRPGKQEEPKALVTLDGEGVDWTCHAEDEQENFALMAYSNSGSDTEVTSCSKECVESYAKLKKLYDEQREQLGDASIEIQAYTQALKKKLLAEAVKEKEELKTKLENFQSSSKGLSKPLNSQMSTRDKSRLGSSDVEDSPVYDRFVKVEGMHAVPPPMTGNYMPPKSDFGIDDVETLESVPEPVVVEPKVVSQPKVWSDAPIIEDYESDSDDEYDDPQKALKNKGIVDSGCSRHMTGNCGEDTTASTNVNGEVELTASIDGQAKTITEASLRRHLKLEDNGGITSLPNTEIFEQLALMGFIQICLNKQRRLLQPHTRTYPTPVPTQKVFSNMKRVTRGYFGEDIPLFPSMITVPETSPLRITSSLSLSPQHTPVSALSTSPPPII